MEHAVVILDVSIFRNVYMLYFTYHVILYYIIVYYIIYSV